MNTTFDRLTVLLAAGSLATCLGGCVSGGGTTASASSATTAPPPKLTRIERVQVGDPQLTCTEIQAQLKAVQVSQEEAQRAGAAAKTEADSTRTASMAGMTAIGLIPGLGLFSTAASAGAGGATHQTMVELETQQETAATVEGDARARKEVLVTLANGKSCVIK